MQYKMCFQSAAHIHGNKKKKWCEDRTEFCTLKAFEYCKVKWAKPNITSLGTHWRFNHMLGLTRSRSLDASWICRRFSFFYSGGPWLALWRTLLSCVCYRTDRLWPYCKSKTTTLRKFPISADLQFFGPVFGAFWLWRFSDDDFSGEFFFGLFFWEPLESSSFFGIVGSSFSLVGDKIKPSNSTKLRF